MVTASLQSKPILADLRGSSHAGLDPGEGWGTEHFGDLG